MSEIGRVIKKKDSTSIDHALAHYLHSVDEERVRRELQALSWDMNIKNECLIMRHNPYGCATRVSLS